ncbi:L-threonine ammonia-lyase-like [Pectinophora gossypiella]|uniref:L-threonine ammonia-lyase-like n=1 Tax=Pectinophora gossypiella TaxID=13191 RepID=UPI00214F22E8|nr:L-threonine ammonia-lyase-like [Pectinophora gossypiella]
MTRRIEDFDEFCDPDNPKILKYEEVSEASALINPYIQRVSLLSSHSSKKFAINLHYKCENLQRTGSFKERGVINALLHLPLDKKKLGVVVASLGNEGISMSYYGAKFNIPVIIVIPTSVQINYTQRCHSYGAKVLVQGSNLAEAMRYARGIARDKGLTYINSRDHPHMLSGYGTLASEILQEMPSVDAIMVPIGTGGLAAAVSSVVKHLKPKCLVYGIQPETTPTFFKMLQHSDNEPVLVVNKPTMADSTSVTQIGVNSFAMVQPYLDKMLLVKEEWIARAMLHMFERQKMVVEGAAACPLAAILGSLVPELKMKNVVMVLTGGNVNNLLYSRCLERGLSAEGRLVKFTVGIQDNTPSQKQLLNLLASGGYDLIHQFQTHKWLDYDEYKLEMCLVCAAKHLEHALELKRIIDRAYPFNVVFETEPFNDKRTCPCYVYKNICVY